MLEIIDAWRRDGHCDLVEIVRRGHRNGGGVYLPTQCALVDHFYRDVEGFDFHHSISCLLLQFKLVYNSCFNHIRNFKQTST